MDGACPACGEEATEILRHTPQNVTLRCTECRHVWNTPPPRLRTRDVPLIVSDGESSWKARIEVVTDDVVSVGDEFEHEGHRMQVTAIDVDGRHPDDAAGAQIKVLHARVFDTVTLRISVNEGEITRSYSLDVAPEDEVHIGKVIDVDGRRLAVKTLKSDQNRTLHKGFLLARNVRRAFCDPAPERAAPGARVQTRRRGAPPGAKKKRL